MIEMYFWCGLLGYWICDFVKDLNDIRRQSKEYHKWLDENHKIKGEK